MPTELFSTEVVNKTVVFTFNICLAPLPLCQQYIWTLWWASTDISADEVDVRTASALRSRLSAVHCSWVTQTQPATTGNRKAAVQCWGCADVDVISGNVSTWSSEEMSVLDRQSAQSFQITSNLHLINQWQSYFIRSTQMCAYYITSNSDKLHPILLLVDFKRNVYRYLGIFWPWGSTSIWHLINRAVF